MAQLIVRNIDDDVRDKLRVLAAENGRSMEEEIREILREAALRAALRTEDLLGTRIAARFRGCGINEGEIEELRGHSAQPAVFRS